MVVAILGAVPAAPRIELQIARATYDPLDAVDITVRMYNGSPSPVVMQFPQTDEYALALTDGSSAIWSSPAGGKTKHARAFAPGYTTLVTYEWNGVLTDGSAPAPGEYALHGTLLSTGAQPNDRAVLRITAPLPISALAKTGAQVVTVAGTLDAIGMTLHDASGDVKLARRITGPGANLTVDVRGSMAVQPDGTRAFVIERWAPAAYRAWTQPRVIRSRATRRSQSPGENGVGPDRRFLARSIDANVRPDEHGALCVALHTSKPNG